MECEVDTVLSSSVMTAVWRRRLFLAGPPLGLLLLAVISLPDDGPTLCPFALCTGTACPGCGMTRAASALLRGDFDIAVAYHPLVPLVLAQALVAWGWYVLRQRGRVGAPRRGLVNAALMATAVALIGVWLFRLASGTLPVV